MENFGQQRGFKNAVRAPVFVKPNSADDDSDSESVTSEQIQMFDNGFIILDEGDGLHDDVKKFFLSGMGSIAAHTTVVAIHKHSYPTSTGHARLQSFRIHAEAMKTKRGLYANITHIWHGTSKDGIEKIFSHGFGKPENDGLFGYGVYLGSPLECAKSLDIGEDGLRHLVLCRVILGKEEVVHPGSNQSHPSSEDFDCGVDKLATPSRYIVWTTRMNTHILPEYVVSFRAPQCLRGAPAEPILRFENLFSELSRFLPKDAITLIEKHHIDHCHRKMSRQEMIQRIGQVTGRELLTSVVRCMVERERRAQSGRSLDNNSN